MKGRITFKTILGTCISLASLTSCESQMRDLNSFPATTITESITADSISPENYDQQASFPGGQEALLAFLDQNVRYPDCYDGCGQGRVVVSFSIDTDGIIVDPKVIRSVDKELDAEALRVVSLMPKWEPGYQGDSLVRVKYNLPVTFKMGEPSSLPTNNSKDN